MSGTVRLLGVLLVLALLAGCAPIGGVFVTGSGRETTRDYDFSGFTRVEISSAFEATIDQGENHAVSVSVDDNLVEYLDVRLEGDTLHIGMQPRLSLSFRDTIQRAEITMPSLESLGVSGATQVRLSGFDSSARLDLEASGASQIRGDVNSSETVMRVSGASTVEIEGTTGNLDAEASGASTVRLSNFTAQDARVNASGASNITVNASGSVTGEASGASTIRYIGEPRSVRVDTSGASNVQQQ